MTKFKVGDQVKATKGSQIGNIGVVEKVIAVPWDETEYQVGFSTKPYGMTLLESSLQKVQYMTKNTGHLVEMVKSIGAISTIFTEADIKTDEIFKESIDLSAIKTVTHQDVTSKHFVDWFFMMEDFAEIAPEQFPFYLITHSDEFAVFGYFNGDKLDGIIRVDEYVDNYELSFFFVNKALQHQGIGQHLFQYILDRFSDKKLILYVYKDNDRAIHIYKKYGFKITGTDYDRGYKPWSPHYIMQRDMA